MSTELQDPEGIEAAHTALDEFHATHDECTEFFGDVFDQLQTLSLELFARHKCLEMNNGRKPAADASVVASRDEFRRATEPIQQLANKIESQLSRLTGVANDLLAAREQMSPETHIGAILEGMRWQQADWLQQRAALEAEIDALRRRNMEQEEALHDQKRLAARQQAELAGEMKRMRSLLEALTGQLRGDPADGKRGTTPDSLLLGSVLAQFQMLQRDSSLRKERLNSEAAPQGTPPSESNP